jgi:transcription initiation factor TFIIE subunit alpha
MKRGGFSPLDNGKLALRNPEANSVLLEMVGEEGLGVVQCLLDSEETDERISEATELRLNTVRKILYKLYDYRLASYVRTKDKEIGWYTYTWKLNLNNISNIILIRKKNILDELNKRLEFERNHVFFSCSNDALKVSFDTATENGFRCPTCDSALEFVDNQQSIIELEERIRRIEKEINQ